MVKEPLTKTKSRKLRELIKEKEEETVSSEVVEPSFEVDVVLDHIGEDNDLVARPTQDESTADHH